MGEALLVATASDSGTAIAALCRDVAALDGDVVIVDPEKPWICDQKKLFTKGHVSCFEGESGKGAPICTIIRGKIVAENGMFKEQRKGYGKFVRPL